MNILVSITDYIWIKQKHKLAAVLTAVKHNDTARTYLKVRCIINNEY